jgi:hypothetical protein
LLNRIHLSLPKYETAVVSGSQAKTRWIASLSSFVVHLLLLILLAIWTVVGLGKGRRFSMESGISDDQGEQVETVEISQSSDADASPASSGADTLSTTTILTEMPELLDPLSGQTTGQLETLADAIRFSGQTLTSGSNGFVGLSTESRTVENRRAAAARHGGTAASEAAVEAALAYLARHQRNNGSWSMGFDVCNEECTDGCKDLDKKDIAATGLALLCFLGAGHTMHQGDYSDNVSRGVYYLVQNMKFRKDGTQGYWLTEQAAAQMYEHGIATLALCESLQMTGDTSLKGPCQAAINYIVAAQHKDGGWGYHPSTPGDLSIVGWQMMALKSASAAGIKVFHETLHLADNFLKREASGPFLYTYRRGKPTASMTAIGNLIRIFRGNTLTDGALMRANDYIAKQGPSRVDSYYNYYATQFMFQMGGERWKNWNLVMRELLVQTQVQQGHMAGSWYTDGELPYPNAGRIYITTMNCLTLEVYYRYLPVYESSTDEFKF